MQWLAVLALALTVRHNGWLYYAGGDQLWHYSGAYLLAHGHCRRPSSATAGRCCSLPLARVRRAEPRLRAAGDRALEHAGAAARSRCSASTGSPRGSAGGSSATSPPRLWIALPYFGILFVEPGYHQKYTELTIPQIVGLTCDAGLPEHGRTAGLRVSVPAGARERQLASRGAQPALRRVRRSRSSRRTRSSSSPPRCCCCSTRWRTRLPVRAAGSRPRSLTLALWKYRGLGQLGAAPAEPVRLASGVGRPARPNPQPGSSTAGRTSTPGARRAARALLGRARAGVAAGGGRDRAARALATRFPADRAAGSSPSCCDQGHYFAARWTTRASSAS